MSDQGLPSADHPADACQTRIPSCGEQRSRPMRLDAHRPELEDIEARAIATYPLLPKQNRPAIVEQDGKRYYRKQRRDDQQAAESADDVQQALELRVARCPLRKNEISGEHGAPHR